MSQAKQDFVNLYLPLKWEMVLKKLRDFISFTVYIWKLNIITVFKYFYKYVTGSFGSYPRCNKELKTQDQNGEKEFTEQAGIVTLKSQSGPCWSESGNSTEKLQLYPFKPVLCTGKSGFD